MIKKFIMSLFIVVSLTTVLGGSNMIVPESTKDIGELMEELRERKTRF